MKALAVKGEDRFNNMESFIGALNGRAWMKNQTAAGTSQHSQAPSYGQTAYDQRAYGQPAYGQRAYGQTAYGQPVYGQSDSAQYPYSDGPGEGKKSVFSGLLDYLKANPVVACLLGGGLLVVIVLCIILPVALSGGKTTSTAGDSGGNTSPIAQRPATIDPGEEQSTVPEQPTAPEQTTVPEETTVPEQPTEPAQEMVMQDLGVLNAVIKIPSDYVVEDGTAFLNEAENCFVLVDYGWNVNGPIYSLADVESQGESIVVTLMEGLEVSDYQILAAGPDQVGSSQAYQIYFEGTDNEGVSLEMVIMAVEGYAFGCYFIIAAYPKGDESAKGEIYSILQSFESTGMPEVTYTMYYGSKSGVQVIIDDAVAGGRVMDTTVNMGSAGAIAELVIYPTDEAVNAGLGNIMSDSAGGVEVLNAGQMGLSGHD